MSAWLNSRAQADDTQPQIKERSLLLIFALCAADAQYIFQICETALYSYRVANNYEQLRQEGLEPLFHEGSAYAEFGSPDDRAGCVIQKDDHIVVSFHGTRNGKDWMTDLDVRAIPLAHLISGKSIDGNIHKGFYKRAETFYHSLAQILLPYKQLNLPFVFTGHSLGGALAQIAALNFKLDNPDEAVDVITFGSPKVFTPEAADKFIETIGMHNHKRVIIKDEQTEDPVPNLPPSLLTNFVHADSELYILPPIHKEKSIDCHKLSTYYLSTALSAGQELIYYAYK